MASKNLLLNDMPQDLFATLSLSAAGKYTVQNVGDRRAYFWEAVTAPDPAAVRANFVEPGAWGVVDAPAAGASWWWSDPSTTITLIEMS